MTTVVYANNILAADSRITAGMNLSKHKCPDCDSNKRPVADTSTKIETGYSDKVKFRGEQVLAVGRAGNVTQSKGIMKILRQGGDIELFQEQVRTMQLSNCHHYFLLIVTESAVYEFDPEPNETEVIKYGRDEVVAIGSGAYAALMMLKMFDINAGEAILTASHVDPATGGNVDVINFTEEKLKVTVMDVSDRGEKIYPTLVAKVKKKFSDLSKVYYDPIPAKVEKPAAPAARKPGRPPRAKPAPAPEPVAPVKRKYVKKTAA